MNNKYILNLKKITKKRQLDQERAYTKDWAIMILCLTCICILYAYKYMGDIQDFMAQKFFT